MSNENNLSRCNCLTARSPCCLFEKYLNLPLHIPATLSQYLSKGQIKGLSLKKKIKGDDMTLNLLINS